MPRLSYHPVLVLPPDYVVLDLSKPMTEPPYPWSVGRYDEVRAIYTQDLFGGERCVHVGIDLGGPAGVAVHAFAPGTVLFAGVNPADGDYGPTVVTEHELDGRPIWALHGHLSRASLDLSPPGRSFAAGEVLGWLGAFEENGGWIPHVHFQLSWERPTTHDLPGVFSEAERESALARFPDPRMVLGPLY